MENSPKEFHPIRMLFRRRQRRVWAYVAWLLVYIATALFFAGDIGAQPFQMLPFLIPLALVIVQMIYPTLFVWALMVIPSVLYSGVGVYYLIRSLAEKEWQYDLEGVVLGSVVITIYIVVSVGLIWSRPKQMFSSTAHTI